MRMGFGTSALVKGLEKHGLDGLGYYTIELGQSLVQLGQDLTPITFGPTSINTLFDQPIIKLPRISYGVALACTLGVNHPNSQKARTSIDLYHATDHYIPRFKSVPVIATIMDAIPLARPEWVNQRLRATKNYLFKRTAGWANRVITISEYSKSDLVTYLNIRPENIDVIPLGVDSRYFQAVDSNLAEPYLKKLGLSNGEFFLFIGTLQPRKNLETLIKAYLTLPGALRAQIPLIIVGRDGWGSDELVAQLNAYTAQPTSNIVWLRGVSDLHKRILLQNATALVFPSLYEGFGLPVLEAFASGLPTIASNTTSLPEVAHDAAVLVNPLDADEMGNAMQNLLDDTTLRGFLTERGLKRAQLYTWGNCAKLTYDSYKKLL